MWRIMRLTSLVASEHMTVAPRLLEKSPRRPGVAEGKAAGQGLKDGSIFFEKKLKKIQNAVTK